MREVIFLHQKHINTNSILTAQHNYNEVSNILLLNNSLYSDNVSCPIAMMIEHNYMNVILCYTTTKNIYMHVVLY